MNHELWIIFGILLITLILFLTPWIRLDVTALSMLLSLLLLDLITPQEALAGFSQPVVLMIAGLFIVGGTLLQTGIAFWVGKQLIRLTGSNESTLMILLMLSTATLSAFMSSTGTMAVFLPITMSLSQSLEISPSKLLLPLSFSALLGGTLTLIGTPPNMIVSNALKQSGFSELGFFALTPLGLSILTLAIVYMLVMGRFLLPTGHVEEKSDPLLSHELIDSFQLSEHIFQLKLSSFSPLCHKTLKELNIPDQFHVGILSMSEEAHPKCGQFCLVSPHTELLPEHVLVIEGHSEQVKKFALDMHLEFLSEQQTPTLLKAKKSFINELVIRPRSKLIGKTLKELNFREHYQVTVLSLKRQGQKVMDIPNTPLKFADLLLVQGQEKYVKVLSEKFKDFISLDVPLEHGHSSRFKTIWALLVVLSMLLLMSTGWMAPLTSVLFAVVMLLLGRSITMEDAYRSINWESIILIACMMPMATALEKAGGVQLLSSALVQYLGQNGPLYVLGGLFLVTSGLSLFISNTATTVLMAPIALSIAQTMKLSPYPFMVVIAIAASSAFSTPVATPVNTMIVGPGKYSFKDFVKVGLPLQLLILALTLVLVGFFFPLKHS